MNWNDLSLSSLTYFVDAIELGSLTESAEKNHVSRPAVSKAIRRIEDILGFDLIEHGKNSLSLTAEGREFFERAAASLRSFASSLALPLSSARRTSLACSATLAEYLILPAIKNLGVERFNSVGIRIGSTAKVRQLVADGDVRLGFVIDDGSTHGLQTVSLAKGEYVLRSRTGAMTGPLLTTEPRPEVSHLIAILRRRKKTAGQHIEIESWSTCLKAAELLGGVCLVPDLVPAAGLKAVRDVRYGFPYEVKAICKNLNLLNPAESTLLRALSS